MRYTSASMPALERHDVRREDDRRGDPRGARLLHDLGAVTVTAQAVRANVAVDFGEHRADRRRAARAGDPALRVDHDLRDAIGERPQRNEREQRRGDVAARVRDQARAGDLVAIAFGKPDTPPRPRALRAGTRRRGRSRARPLARNAGACSRASSWPPAMKDDVVGAHARQRRPALFERDVHVRRATGKTSATAMPGCERLSSTPSATRGMAVDQADELGGGVTAGADDVGGDHASDSDERGDRVARCGDRGGRRHPGGSNRRSASPRTEPPRSSGASRNAERAASLAVERRALLPRRAARARRRRGALRAPSRRRGSARRPGRSRRCTRRRRARGRVVVEVHVRERAPERVERGRARPRCRPSPGALVSCRSRWYESATPFVDATRAGVDADRARAGGAHELERIGIALLRHQARAGRGRVVEPHVAERRRRPDHELFARPRRGDGRAHRGVEQVEHDVAVADAVERVARRLREAELARGRVAVERQRRARQRRAAERAEARARRRRRARTVPRRARTLAPRRRARTRAAPAARAASASSRRAACRARARLRRDLRAARRRRAQLRAPRCARSRAYREECRRDLIVARASGVQPFAGGAGQLAHARVDRAVHVLEVARRRPSGEGAVVDLAGDAVERIEQRAARRPCREPPAPSAATCAREQRTSNGASSRSSARLEPNASSAASGADAKRPPHCSELIASHRLRASLLRRRQRPLPRPPRRATRGSR